MSADKQGSTRFTADVMLGSLAQYLLLAGLDCTYHDQIDDAELIEHATEENRVLLTRDRALVDAAPPSLDSLLFTDQDVVRQMRELNERYELDVTEETLFTRCTYCNRTLEQISPAEARPNVPPQTWAWKDRYFQCPECSQVYWKGSHYREVKERLRSWGILDSTP